MDINRDQQVKTNNTMAAICRVLVLVHLLFIVSPGGAQQDVNGNDKILEKEINEALSECGESAERQAGEKEYKRIISRTKRNIFYFGRNKRNLNVMMEQMHHYLKEDSGSGEWDYGGGGGKRNAWEGGEDERQATENVYQHERRNNTHHGDKASYGGGTAIHQQNSTRYNHDGVESRRARLRPTEGVRDDINKNNESQTPERKRRSDSLVSVASRAECLSQCIFTNIKVVDERGIPKEGLFMKLIQEAITSQQMKVLVERQLKNCFRQLAGESQNDSCLYSNALEQCMGLQLNQRMNMYKEAVSTSPANI